MAGSPYQVAVAIALSSNHGAILGALSNHLLGIHSQVNALHGGFSRLKLAIGGALAVGAGVGILHTMISLVEKTKEYSNELAKLERMGGTMTRDVRSGAAANTAFDTAIKSNLKVTDVMKLQGQTYSILGDDGKKVLEPLAKFGFLMQSDKDFKGDAGSDLAKFLRSGELGGRLTDPHTHKAAIEEVQKFLDLSAKVMTATHGMVTPQTLLGMTQQAGFSMRGMDEKGFMSQAIYAQAMGGPRSGTALLSLFNQAATGTMTKRAAKGMINLGLLKESEVTSNHGGVLIDTKAKQRLGGLLGKDPMDLLDTIYANLQKRGITDPQEQMRLIADAMSRQTSQRYAIEGMMNREQMRAERERMQQGFGGQAGFDVMMNKSVAANQEALANAWNNLLMAVAGPNAENTIAILKMLTDGINDFTRYLRSVDPQTLKNIAIGIAALGAVFMTAGVVAMIAAMGPGGAIVLGVAAVAGAMNLLSKVNWKGIGDTIMGFASKFFDFKDAGKAAKAQADERDNLIANVTRNGVKAMINPNAGAVKPQTTHLSLNIDGRTLGQVVAESLASLSEHNTNSPDFNGAAAYGP